MSVSAKPITILRRLPTVTALSLGKTYDGPPTLEFSRLTGASTWDAVWLFPAMARITNAFKPLRNVYFARLGDTDSVKIGVTWDVDRRLGELRKELRDDCRKHGVVLLGTVPGDVREEGWIHAQLRDARIPRHVAPTARGREWFRFSMSAGLIRETLLRGYIAPRFGFQTHWRPAKGSAA